MAVLSSRFSKPRIFVIKINHGILAETVKLGKSDNFYLKKSKTSPTRLKAVVAGYPLEVFFHWPALARVQIAFEYERETILP